MVWDGMGLDDDDIYDFGVLNFTFLFTTCTLTRSYTRMSSMHFGTSVVRVAFFLSALQFLDTVLA
jgi:hypothetical protein